MARLDLELEQFDEAFAEWFEDDVEVTNYTNQEVQTAPDEYDSLEERQETEDSPIATTAQIDLLNATAENTPWGREVDANFEIWIDGVPISDGTVDGMPYPSDVTDVATGEKYRIVDIHDEKHGHTRCLATNVGA